MDDSNRGDGAAASDAMRGSSDIFADMAARLKRLEDRQDEIQAAHNRNSETGLTSQPYPGFGRHVVHVMTKHFYHDVPDGTIAGDVRDESERNRQGESRPSTYGG